MWLVQHIGRGDDVGRAGVRQARRRLRVAPCVGNLRVFGVVVHEMPLGMAHEMSFGMLHEMPCWAMHCT